MRVAFIGHDKPGHLQVRLDNRTAHIDYLRQTSGSVEMAGPLLDDAGQMCGSLVILGVATMEEAQAWAAADPYAKAGLFASTQLIQWNRVIG
jgi:uncharacterized protein YciI